MSEATLIEWVAGDGATVVEGDPMSCVEPDNVDEDISGPGSLHRIAAAAKLYQVSDRLAAIN